MAHKVEDPSDLSLHKDAFEYAKELIHNGKVNCSKYSWTIDEPTPDDENHYIKEHGYRDYGKWHLGTKIGTEKETKEHYEFPIGNFDKIFRSGVIAAKHRAAQFKHKEIEQAASELLEIIDKDACKT